MLFSLKQIPIPEIVRYALGTALPSPIPQEFLSLAQTLHRRFFPAVSQNIIW